MHNKLTLERANDSKATIKRVWKYLKKYKFRLFLVFLFIILSITFNTISSLLLAPIIDNYITPMIGSADPSIYVFGLIRQIIYLISCAIFASLSSYLQYKSMIKVAQFTVRDMRQDLFNRLSILPVKYYDTHTHGDLMSSITNDLDNVSAALNNSIDQIVAAVLNLIITLIVMFNISGKLTLISIISVPLLSLVSFFIVRLTKKHFAKQQESLANLNGYIEEYISGQKVIKAFNKEEDVLNSFDKHNENLRVNGFKAQAYGSIVMPVMGSLNNISIAITYICAGIMAIKGRISVGKITSFVKFARQFTQPINEISQQASVIQSGLAGAERVFAIIDEDLEFSDSLDKPKLENVIGNVEFKNVNFGYDDEVVLKDINLKVNRGETIAIVGPTGAGKTTIINLLTRFYDVNSGEILIDGKNIKDVNFYSLRDNLGIVLQDTVLFSLSVKDNIKFGKLDATDEEVIKAAKLAGADSFIRKLPNKYDTLLNEDTSNISVGQRQLLNIARVILNDPKILILDEATSNVDTRTEVKVQQAMNKLLDGRTSFVIAHRLSTIRNADKIIVIDDGMIVEAGNHDELINKKGMYYKMYTGMFK